MDAHVSHFQLLMTRIGPMAEWSFLTNHARVLLCIARDPGIRLREIAATVGITERTAFGVVADLTEAGYVIKERDGRGTATRCNTTCRWWNRRLRNARSARCSSSSAVVKSHATENRARLPSGSGAPPAEWLPRIRGSEMAPGVHSRLPTDIRVTVAVSEVANADPVAETVLDVRTLGRDPRDDFVREIARPFVSSLSSDPHVVLLCIGPFRRTHQRRPRPNTSRGFPENQLHIWWRQAMRAASLKSSPFESTAKRCRQLSCVIPTASHPSAPRSSTPAPRPDVPRCIVGATNGGNATTRYSHVVITAFLPVRGPTAARSGGRALDLGRRRVARLGWPRGRARDRIPWTHRLGAPPATPGRRPPRRAPGAWRTRRDPTTSRWDPEAGTIDAAGLEGVDAVVHLAGAGIGDKKWTPDRKQLILESRTAGHRPPRPHPGRPPAARRRCWCRARRWATTATGVPTCSPRQAPPGDDFPAQVCVAWEARHRPGGRGRDPGGAPSAPGSSSPPTAAPSTGCCCPFKLGLGGRIGSGEQYMSWITLDDHVGAIRHVLTTDSVSGPVNLTAPNPATNAEFTHALGGAVHRPDGAADPAAPVEGGVRRRARASTCSSTVSASSRACCESTGYEFAHAEHRRARCARCSQLRLRRESRRSRNRGWGDRGVSNPRPPGPQPGALAN